MTVLANFTEAELGSALGGRFEIVSVLRPSGQARVFRARRHTSLEGMGGLNDDVALKVHLNTAELTRVDREVDALDGFEHPCLARFVEHGTICLQGQATRYVAWRYIEGIDLAAHLAAGPARPHLVACIGRDVSRAIEHIWKKRIVHRDINPKNIIIPVGESSAVLIDLGVARFLDQSVLTAAGMTWGTRGYFSPEQWFGDNISCHSDVFCLAVTMLEALVGSHPTHLNQEALLSSSLKTANVCPTAPVRLAEVLDRCLAIRAAFRPHPKVLAEELAEVAAELS